MYVEGRQVTRRFDTKAQATAWEAQTRHEAATGRYIDARDGATTFATYAERYLAHARVADTTMELYRSHLRRHILPAIGSRPLSSLRRSDMVALVTDASATLAPATVKVVYGITAGILRSAVDDRLLLSSPCSRVPLPTVHRDTVRHLTPAQARTLLGAARPEHRAAIAVALGHRHTARRAARTAGQRGELAAAVPDHCAHPAQDRRRPPAVPRTAQVPGQPPRRAAAGLRPRRPRRPATSPPSSHGPRRLGRRTKT